MSNHPWKKDLETIVQQTSRCRNIVRGLLDFARQRKPDKRASDISALLEKTLTLLEKQAPFQNIRDRQGIRRRDPAGLYRWRSDRAGLHEHHAQRGRCDGRDRGNASHSRRDSGTEWSKSHLSTRDRGLPKKTSPSSSIPFLQQSRPERERGLGLAISYGIIQSHNGDIRVTSDVGKGSTFRISLPISPDLQQQAGVN